MVHLIGAHLDIIYKEKGERMMSVDYLVPDNSSLRNDNLTKTFDRTSLVFAVLGVLAILVLNLWSIACTCFHSMSI